jgi:hypothetical protein
MTLLERMTLPQGKANHAVYGGLASFAGAIAGPLATALGLPSISSRMGALAATLAAGVGKEAYDWAAGRGKPDWRDFTATVLGGLPAFILAHG